MALGIGSKFTSQEINVVISEVAINSALKNMNDKLGEKEVESRSSQNIEETLQKMINDPQSAGMDAVKTMAAKFAAANLSGIQNLPDFQKEIKDLKQEDEPSAKEADKDSVSITKNQAKLLSRNAVTRMNDIMNGYSRSGGEDAKDLAGQYFSAYSEFITNDSPKAKARLEKLEQALKEKGVSESTIGDIKKEARACARADIAAKLKESFLMRDLSGSKLEEVFQELSIFAIADEAISGNNLSGEGIEANKTEAQQMVNDAASEVKEDLKDFARMAIEDKLISKMAKQDYDMKDVNPLLELCKKSGLNIGHWAANIWPKQKENLGFNLIDVPDNKAGVNVNTNTDDPRGRRQPGPEYDDTDEKQVLINRLRAIYMQRLMHTDARSQIQTMFKIRRIKSGLLKLGIYNRELDEKVAFEAEIVAKTKTLDMLKEAFLERATLYHMKGPAHGLLEKKIESLLKNAKRLSIELSEGDLDNLKYNAAKRMLDVVRRQMEVLNGAPANKKSNHLKSDISKLKLLEKRLVGEVNGTNPKENESPVYLNSEIA